MVDIEKIKGLTFQKRLVEGFKVVRKDGIKARLGPSWGVERQLTREPAYTFMPQWVYAPMAQYGRTRGHLQCDSERTAIRVVDILRNHGVACHTATGTRSRVELTGIDDSLIGKKELEEAMKNLTREVLVETYSLD